MSKKTLNSIDVEDAAEDLVRLANEHEESA